MVIIKSLSSIRGTLEGENGLSPKEIIKFSSGFVYWIKKKHKKKKYYIILGRDGRFTSKLFHKLIIVFFNILGINVVDIGLSTTPTLAMSIISEKTQGGIMITASHNPKNWNGLKIFNSIGESLCEKEFNKLLKMTKKKYGNYISYKKIGFCFKKSDYIKKHIEKVLSIPIVDKNLIKKSNFKIVVDGINSTGGIAVPIILKKLGVNIIKIYCNPNGDFVHNPEPVEKNLKDICKKVKDTKSDLGIAVDPDVDRVVFICENGIFFGEEYTLVAIADYVLNYETGPVVSTSSSSNALYDLSVKKNVPFYGSPVGEVNIVKVMKKVNAVIGGEGNGSIIYPKFRYGRDALVGIALFLTYISKLNKIPLSILKTRYSSYFMSKKKIKISYHNYKTLLKKIILKYKKKRIEINDGIKIYFNNEWIHIRKSNTENVIRVHSQSISKKRAHYLSNNIINEIKKIL